MPWHVQPVDPVYRPPHFAFPVMTEDGDVAEVAAPGGALAGWLVWQPPDRLAFFGAPVGDDEAADGLRRIAISALADHAAFGSEPREAWDRLLADLPYRWPVKTRPLSEITDALK